MKMETTRALFILLTMGVATLCFFPLILTFILRDSFARLPLVRDLVRPYNPKPEEFMTAAQDPATLIQPKPEDFAMHSPSAPQDPATILQSDHQDPATLPQYKPEEPVLFTPSSVPKDPAKYPESRFQDLTIPSEPHAASLTNTSVRLLEQRSEFLEQPTQGNDNNLHLKPVDPHVIIYNRVPKCASATMLRICLGLSERNNFSFNNMRDLGRHDSREDQEKLGKWIFQRSLASRHFFFEHMTYINFTSLGFWEPSWINVVRHPVNRYISHYYYKRPNQTLDVCIRTGKCDFQYGENKIPSQISYFFGYTPKWKLKLNTRVLQRAKQVVEKEFVVVGIQEQLDDTLLVLQHLIPNIFAGVTEMEYKNWNIQASKPPTSNKTLSILQRWLRIDIEFYDYLKQRFHKQLEKVKEQLRNNL